MAATIGNRARDLPVTPNAKPALSCTYSSDHPQLVVLKKREQNKFSPTYKSHWNTINTRRSYAYESNRRSNPGGRGMCRSRIALDRSLLTRRVFQNKRHTHPSPSGLSFLELAIPESFTKDGFRAGSQTAFLEHGPATSTQPSPCQSNRFCCFLLFYP